VSATKKGFKEGTTITGVGAGLRETTVYAVQGSTFKLPSTPVNSTEFVYRQFVLLEKDNQKKRI
jgi:hypothetical protein